MGPSLQSWGSSPMRCGASYPAIVYSKGQGQPCHGQGRAGQAQRGSSPRISTCMISMTFPIPPPGGNTGHGHQHRLQLQQNYVTRRGYTQVTDQSLGNLTVLTGNRNDEHQLRSWLLEVHRPSLALGSSLGWMSKVTLFKAWPSFLCLRRLNVLALVCSQDSYSIPTFITLFQMKTQDSL